MKSAVPFRQLLCLMIAFLFLSCSATAQSKSGVGAGIGKVDFRALVLLHPSMMKYDPQKCAFKLDAAKSGSQQQNLQRSKERQERILQLENEERALRAKITELHRNHTRDLSAATDAYVSSIAKLATGPAGMKQQQFEIDKMQLESSYQAKLKSVSGQLIVTGEERERLEKVVLHPGYTTPEETAGRFAAIVKEVRQIIQQTASQRGIQIVLNSSYQRSLRAIPAERDGFVPADLSYYKIFTLPFTREVEGNHNFVAGYYENLTGMARDWLNHGNIILTSINSSLVDSDIIIGGTDLTGDVLSALFTSYNVNPNIAAAVIKAALEP